MISLHDERVRAVRDVLTEYLRGRLEQAGSGYAIGYRLKAVNPVADQPTESAEYETHLVELDANGQLTEGLAGFHYVTLRK